jgi:hypothetical protein
MADEALCEGVRTLLQAAAGFLPVRGLGVVRPDGPEHVVLTYVDVLLFRARRKLRELLRSRGIVARS